MLTVWTEEQIEQAAQSLKKGEVLAYPTEAVWGIGVDPYNETAFQKLLSLKNRCIDKGVILIAGEVSQIENWLVFLSPSQKELVLSHWPGPHTWLVPKPDLSPVWLSGEHPFVALRVTAHPLVQKLCAAFGGPIISTSANLSGQLPARSLSDAQQYFDSQVHYLNGNTLGAERPTQIRNALTGEIVRA